LADHGLNSSDKADIERTDGWLNDKVIDAVNGLVGKHLGQTSTQSSILVQGPTGFSSNNAESIQIVHDINHWVATACIGEKVLVADSLGKATLSERVKAQLQQLYSSQITDSGMEVTMVPCPRQTNGADCGVYAAAVAYAWAEGQAIPMEWDVAGLRPHLIKSLEQSRVTSFPIGKEPMA